MADLASPIISAGAGLAGVLVGAVGQVLVQRSAARAARLASIEEYQRDVLTELQDGAVVGLIRFTNALYSYLHENWDPDPDAVPMDLDDGNDPVWEEFYREVAKVKRVARKVRDERCRSRVDVLIGEVSAWMATGGQRAEFHRVDRAESELLDRIGVLLRGDGQV